MNPIIETINKSSIVQHIQLPPSTDLEKEGVFDITSADPDVISNTPPTVLGKRTGVFDITSADPDVISNPPESNLIDDSIAVNEVIIDHSASHEEVRGEFFITLKEWDKIIRTDGDSISFSKDWTNLFCSKLEGIFICVLRFNY